MVNLDEIERHMAERNFSSLMREEGRRIKLLQLADDVPDLVAEVRRLRLQVDDLKKKLANAADVYHLESDHHQVTREKCGNATCVRLTEWVEGKQAEKRVEPARKAIAAHCNGPQCGGTDLACVCECASCVHVRNF